MYKLLGFNDIILSIMKIRNVTLYVMGDFNIKLCSIMNLIRISETLETLSSNLFYPLHVINNPTKITVESSIIIDNIFYKCVI